MLACTDWFGIAAVVTALFGGVAAVVAAFYSQQTRRQVTPPPPANGNPKQTLAELATETHAAVANGVDDAAAP